MSATSDVSVKSSGAVFGDNFARTLCCTQLSRLHHLSCQWIAFLKNAFCSFLSLRQKNFVTVAFESARPFYQNRVLPPRQQIAAGLSLLEGCGSDCLHSPHQAAARAWPCGALQIKDTLLEPWALERPAKFFYGITIATRCQTGQGKL